MKDQKLYKLESLELLKRHNLPVLEHEILNKENFENQVKMFIKKINKDKFLIRTDGLGKFSPSVNNATLKNDSQKIKEFFEKGYTVFVMHPGSIHTNLHGLNIMKEGNEIILEIVGQGFITHDLNKWGLLHEKIILDSNSLEIKDRKIITQAKYSQAILKKMKEFPITELGEENSLLLRHKKYIPFTDKELHYVRDNFHRMESVSKDLGAENFIANMSFIDFGNGKYQPIFWDLYGL